VTKEEQQQPREASNEACANCGNTTFFRSPMMDTKANRMVSFVRCKRCEAVQQTPNANG
jgi:hypothetical protein